MEVTNPAAGLTGCRRCGGVRDRKLRPGDDPTMCLPCNQFQSFLNAELNPPVRVPIFVQVVVGVFCALWLFWMFLFNWR